MENSNTNLIIERVNGVGWIKLDRPKALNALSWDMVHRIQEQLNLWKDDQDISLICITSTQDKAFCAGGDVKAVYLHVQDGDRDYPAQYLAKQYVMDYTIHTYPKLVLAYMNGFVMGGGVGISIGCKYKIATEKTKWAMPEVQIGFFPDVAASYFFNQMPGSIGRFLALTAETLDGQDLIYLKVANYFVHSEKWKDIEEEIKSMNWNITTCESELENILQRYRDIEPRPSNIEEIESKINKHFSYDTMEEIIESLEKDAKDNDSWSEQVLKRLSNIPPTSLKATLQLLIKGKKQSLLECFKMELDLGMNMIETHNFNEGTRSVLVDKDRRFDWNPKKLNEVTDLEVESSFQYRWKDDKHLIDELIKLNEYSS